jgi:hypothetical protein
MVYREVSSDNRRPMSRRYDHVKEKAGTGFGWIVLKD